MYFYSRLVIIISSPAEDVEEAEPACSWSHRNNYSLDTDVVGGSLMRASLRLSVNKDSRWPQSDLLSLLHRPIDIDEIMKACPLSCAVKGVASCAWVNLKMFARSGHPPTDITRTLFRAVIKNAWAVAHEYLWRLLDSSCMEQFFDK